MVTEIKVKVVTEYINPETGETSLPKIVTNGDWIDLRAAEDIKLEGPKADLKTGKVKINSKLIKLCTAIKLPAGFEAILDPRSSTPKLNIIQTNSQGIIDNSFCGNTDIWRMWITALDDVTINKGDRICQFRVQLSQKATWKQKIKWLFSSGIRIVEVDNLDSNSRGGIGTSGLN